jgi:hypothetical protein
MPNMTTMEGETSSFLALRPGANATRALLAARRPYVRDVIRVLA